jgi:hypothetical protein
MEHIDKLVEIFVKCDDFYQEFEKFLNYKGITLPLKKTVLSKLPNVTERNYDHRNFLSSGGF